MLDRVFVTHHARGPGDTKILTTSRIEADSVGRGLSLPWRSLAPELLARVQALLGELRYAPLGS